MSLPPTLELPAPPADALVLGCGDVGSAVALALFRAGWVVVLADAAKPAHARRGMAFTDAWFRGEAVLDGVAAHLVDGVDAADDAARAERRPAHILAVADPMPEGDFPLLVDARLKKRERPPRLIDRAPLTIGVGPGFVAGEHVHAVIESAWGEALGEPIYAGSSLPFAGEPRPILGYGRERYVYAPRAGVFRTAAAIGRPVEAGEAVGGIGDWPCLAPLTGVLRGLSADGAEVGVGQKIVEVDPRGDPALCFGIGERPARIAAGVLRAATRLGAGPTAAYFSTKARSIT